MASMHAECANRGEVDIARSHTIVFIVILKVVDAPFTCALLGDIAQGKVEAGPHFLS